MKKLKIPYGVTDYNKEECYKKTAIEKDIEAVLFASGFNKVETSQLEYYSLYKGLKTAEKMFKIPDIDGNLLVLRPDFTMQISRMVASDNIASVEKIYYIGNAYEFISDTSGQSARDREFSQVGAEIIGNTGASGDLEALMLCISSLKNASLNDFLIEVGSVQFFNGIVKDSGLEESEIEEVIKIINRKDFSSLEEFLEKSKVKKECGDILKKLPSLYGREEVLEKAKKLVKDKVAIKAIEDLQFIFSSLKRVGLAKYIVVDLGLIKTGYYSGFLLRGFCLGCGEAILEGGRYDGLSLEFGKKIGAVGFAFGIKRILASLERQGKIKCLPEASVAFVAEPDAIENELQFTAQLFSQKKRFIKLYNIDKRALIKYCSDNKIKKAAIITKSKTEEIIL